MAKTRHIQKRMSQRAIREEMIDLTMKFGIQDQDKVIFNKKGIQELLCELDNIRKTAQKMMEKGGIVVVESGGSLITTYRLDSYRLH